MSLYTSSSVYLFITHTHIPHHTTHTMHAYTNTPTPTIFNMHIHTHTPTNMHVYTTHTTCTHTHAHTHARAHTHTYTHIENENQQDERSVVSPLCDKNRHTPASQPALTTTELGAQGSTAAGHDDNPNAAHSPVGIIAGTVILGCILVTVSLVFLIIAIAIFKKHHSNNRLLIDLTDERVVGHGKLATFRYLYNYTYEHLSIRIFVKGR